MKETITYCLESFVEFIDKMGDDTNVVNAARVSHDKRVTELRPRDEGLINFLAAHGHFSPFAHVSLSLRVTAPIAIARQLAKHQVGLSWNEVSRRYVDSEPKFFLPLKLRKRAPDVKQGSLNESIEEEIKAEQTYIKATRASAEAYEALLELGVCPEQARFILPQNMMTSWIWTGSLLAFYRICTLRLWTEDAQKEVQDIAQQINQIAEKEFPVSWDKLRSNFLLG
jgi:thymidylate synthase (FAD)